MVGVVGGIAGATAAAVAVNGSFVAVAAAGCLGVGCSAATGAVAWPQSQRPTSDRLAGVAVAAAAVAFAADAAAAGVGAGVIIQRKLIKS